MSHFTANMVVNWDLIANAAIMSENLYNTNINRKLNKIKKNKVTS